MVTHNARPVKPFFDRVGGMRRQGEPRQIEQIGRRLVSMGQRYKSIEGMDNNAQRAFARAGFKRGRGGETLGAEGVLPDRHIVSLL